MLSLGWTRALGACLVGAAWLSCTPCFDRTSVCPDRQYHAVGREVASAGECASNADECAFLCDVDTCDGETSALSCEPCADVESYANGDCEDCGMFLFDGAVTFQCTYLK